MKRIGVYGGSFNPPHNGHLIACKEFFKLLNLDRLFIVPAGTAPHKLSKDVEVSNLDRLNMTRLAFSDFEISTFEMDRDDISYTANTILHFNSLFPGDEIIFYMSSDMIYTLQNWYKPYVIAKHCKIACAFRYENEEEKLLEHCKMLHKEYNFNIEIIRFTPLIISSTDVREMIANGDDLKGKVPNTVLSYIKERNLYK